ncbi:MAG: redox-sensing transcriptional repressor Rex [Chitinivibrionales bacterium]
MKKQIPTATIERLCAVYHVLEELEAIGINTVSSIEIGKRLGSASHNIRKDISYFGEIGNCKAGYDVRKLKGHLSNKLGLRGEKKACVVGLGRLGTAILNYGQLAPHGFVIVAGFDSNINKIETISTYIPLYPAHEIALVVKRKGIELAALTVPAQATEETVSKLIEGGIRGIVNFTPAVIKPAKNVFVRNIDLVGEFRILSALSTLTIY